MTATRTNPITAEVIRQAVDGVDSLVRAEVREDYSGRMMGCRSCVGVVLQRPADLLALGASIALVVAATARADDDPDISHHAVAVCAIDDAIDPLHAAQVDNMGRDLIVYWPGVTA